MFPVSDSPDVLNFYVDDGGVAVAFEELKGLCNTSPKVEDAAIAVVAKLMRVAKGLDDPEHAVDNHKQIHHYQCGKVAVYYSVEAVQDSHRKIVTILRLCQTKKAKLFRKSRVSVEDLQTAEERLYLQGIRR